MASGKYCRVQDGQITWGPGLLGRWQHEDGTIYYLREYNNQQLALLGFYPVIETGVPANYDEEYMYKNSPTYIVHPDHVEEQADVQWVPGAKGKMVAAVDIHAQELRGNVGGKDVGELLEYIESWEQAQSALSDIAGNITPIEGDYPMLDAAVGNMTDDQGVEIDTIEKAANEVVKQRQAINSSLQQIRKERLRIKKLVAQAPTLDAALAALKSATWQV